MKYVITNLSVLSSEKEKEVLTAQVERMINKLKIVPIQYVESEKLKINISKVNNFEFRISTSLKLRNSLVFLTESGKDINKLTTQLFDKFRRKVAIQLEKNREWYVKNKKKLRKENIQSYKDDLQEFRMTQDEVSFKSLVKVLLPGLERYVERMLESAKNADILNKGNILPEDIIDEVIIRTFNTFESNQERAEDMNIWMMQETDIVLNELIDSVKHSEHSASIEDLIDSEFASLEEKYMFDGSGTPIMLDELDELDEFDSNESLLGIEEAYLISGSEKEVIDKISDKMSRRQMKQLIRNELVNLPLRHQAVYDLFFFEQTDVEEIAAIKNETEERIEEILEEVKVFLAKRLSI